ncbi:MAG: histidine phosphatase family protein [Candidatus Dormibacteraceae bacterium]
MTVPSRLVLVRHGQSTFNAEHRIQGQLDPPLTPLGQREAEAAATRFYGEVVAGFYCSPLRRARQTAAAIARVLGREPETIEGLREIGLGSWEGRTGAELARDEPELWAQWTTFASWDLVPGGEGRAAFATRISRTLHDLWARHPEGDVLCVTHGGVVQTALHEAIGRVADGQFPFRIENASISVLIPVKGRVVIAGANDVAHLKSLPVEVSH